MTIDELARRSRLSTRNIRAYQAKGLLPPPVLHGRVGRYDEGHLARLRLVARLHAQGFALAGVAELLKAWEEGRSLGDVLGLEEEMTAPWNTEEPVVLSAEEVADLFPQARRRDLEMSAELGLLEPLPDGTFRVPSVRMIEIGAELVRMGVPVSAALGVAEAARRRLAEVAVEFVGLFEQHVWQPFVRAGAPSKRLPAITATLHRLRPLAFDAIASTFATAMEEESRKQVAAMVPAGGSRKRAARKTKSRRRS